MKLTNNKPTKHLPSILIAACLGLAAVAVGAEVPTGQEVAPAPLASDEDLARVKTLEESRVKAVQRVYGAVVAVYGNNPKTGGGSGVLFDSAGFALTNHHVVAAAGVEGFAGLADGKLYKWKLIGTDPGGDLAIIQLSGKDRFPTAPLGDSEKVRVGDWVMAMGNPFNLAEDQRPTVTLGVVSGIKRYQEGAGKNMLVYGNCIQVDSSINPGNSGGPLFNLRGEVIGINGRGSFKERGRVNVGVGYAISMKQIRMFIPELLATKMAQHGTLDALFGNRDGKVLCETINLNGPAAIAGLELGDRLVAFEGEPIEDANHYTNLIATLPADWPAELTIEREGKQRTIFVRLAALRYDPVIKKKPAAADKPKEDDKPGSKEPEKKPEAKPDPAKAPEAERGAKPEAKKAASQTSFTLADERPADKKPEAKPEEKKPVDKQPEDKKPEPKKVIPIKPSDKPRMPGGGAPPPNFGEEGEIRNATMNRKNAALLVKRFRQSIGAEQQGSMPGFKALAMEDEILRNGKKIGEQKIILAPDGRFLVQYTRFGLPHQAGYDGQKFWRQVPDKAAEEIKLADALRDPQLLQGVVLSRLAFSAKEPAADKLLIEGSGKAQGRAAARISLKLDSDEGIQAWFIAIEDGDGSAPQLARAGASTEIDESQPQINFAGWTKYESLLLPYRRGILTTPGEATEYEYQTNKVHGINELPEAMQRSPVHADAK